MRQSIDFKMPKEHFNNHDPIPSFRHVALGGTFDRFHKGHRQFLAKAFAISKRVTIGITSNQFASRLHEHSNLETFNQRKSQVRKFLQKLGVAPRAKLVVLRDIYGPTILDATVEALVVTKNTIKGALAVNRERKKRKKTELKIIELPLTKAADAKSISSARIREGEISREGVVYLSQLLNSTPARLPLELRSTFREPFGKVVPAKAKNIEAGMKKALTLVQANKFEPIICVGDVVTHALLNLREAAKLYIVDLHVERKRRFKKLTDLGPLGHLQTYKVSNPPGTISKKIVKLINKAIKNPTQLVIHVRGEEDLTALPAILLAPLNAAVLYGHFQQGIVVVEVTEEKKTASLKLLQQLNRLSEPADA